MNSISASLDVPPRGVGLKKVEGALGSFRYICLTVFYFNLKKKLLLIFNLLSKCLLCVDTMLSPKDDKSN